MSLPHITEAEGSIPDQNQDKFATTEQLEFHYDSDGSTILNSSPSEESGSDTETESPYPPSRRCRTYSGSSNTGAHKGFDHSDWAYLSDADEGDDTWSHWNIDETFFRNHYSGVNPPERWMSVQDFLEQEKAQGKPTNCGLYLSALFDKVPGIEAEASRLRNGMPCHMDMEHFNKGGFNIVFRIVFEDDQIWVIRIQFPDVLLFTNKQRASHEETQLKALYSQLGSMRYVKRHTKIPVPEIYGYDFSSNNVAGAPYMFMELVQGMSVRKWLEENTLSQERATEFYTQLAEIMWEFYQIRFDKIGELEFDCQGNVHVGGFYDSRTRSAYGPFTSAQEFLSQRQQKLWEFRVLGECRGVQVIDSGFTHWDDLPQESKKLFIAWIYRRVSQHAEKEYKEAIKVATPSPSPSKRLPDYVLFHADLSINNVMVDDDFTITAIIDWDWSASLPKASFDPLPFDMGYETAAQFPGNQRDHESFDHKELYYSIWKTLEETHDPEGRLGQSLIPARLGEDSIATTLNRSAWSYNIERMSSAMLDKLAHYEGRRIDWPELIEEFRLDWIETRLSLPGWLQAIINLFWRRRLSTSSS